MSNWVRTKIGRGALAIGVVCALIVAMTYALLDAPPVLPAALTGADAAVAPELMQAYSGPELPTAPPAARPGNCPAGKLAGSTGAWIYHEMDKSGLPDLVPEQARRLDWLDFYWMSVANRSSRFNEDAAGSGARQLNVVLQAAKSANPCGWRFVTVSDFPSTPLEKTEQYRRMADILFNREIHDQHVLGLAKEVAGRPLLDGVTLDYQSTVPHTLDDLEIFAQTGGFQQLPFPQRVDKVAAAYTQLVQDIAMAMHRQGRLMRVAVPDRSDDDVAPGNLYSYIMDYTGLAQGADQVIMTSFGYHYADSNPGPIAQRKFVQDSWNFLASHGVPAEKLALGVPSYGIDWPVDQAGQTLATGADVTATKARDSHWPQAGTEEGESVYTYTDGQGRTHKVVVSSSALLERLKSYRQLCGCSLAISKLGNADPVGTEFLLAALSR